MVQKIIATCLSRSWSRSGVEYVIRKIDKTGSTQRQVCSGRPRSVRCSEAINEVEDLIVSQEDKPQSHSTQREISWQLKISLGSVNRIVKQDLRLKCFKKCRATELTAANKIARLLRSKQLLEHYPASLVNFIFFTDEKLFTTARPSNSQNYRVYDGINKVKKDVDCRRLLRMHLTFSRSVMVSVRISAHRCTSLQFVEAGVKVNGVHYRKVLLTQGLLPEMRELSYFFTFQQDSAPGSPGSCYCWVVGKGSSRFHFSVSVAA